MLTVSWRKGYAATLAIALVAGAPRVVADERVQLRERFAAGYQYHVSMRTELSGTLDVPPSAPAASAKPGSENAVSPKPLAVTGNSSIEYDERVVTVDADGGVQRTARIYRQVDFQRQVGGRPQQNTIRPEVRRLVLQRLEHIEVPFSPDGPLTWGEIDLVRTDVFTPALTGLFPKESVAIGARWTATNAAIQELTDLERIEEGKVECRLDQVAQIEKRRHARVSFAGTVRGVNEDGPNRQQLEGYCFFDLESNHLSYLSLKGISFMLDRDGKTMGRIEGRFVLTRQAPHQCRQLGDAALKGMTLEPTEDNTLLLYDNPELGLRFLYPRRWRVASAQGRQLTLDEGKGSGLLITLEPAERTPTGLQFLTEVRDWLRSQKARELRVDPVRRVAGVAHELEHFAFDAELRNERVALDYYVTRQRDGGATLAARLSAGDQAGLQKDLERIARSLTVTRRITADAKKEN
jgi:hypothetical protein